MITAGVRRLDDRSAGGCQLLEGFIQVVRPYDQGHGGAAGRRVDSVHSLRCLHCTEPQTEPFEGQLDMFGGPFLRGAKGLFKSEEALVETETRFDVVRV